MMAPNTHTAIAPATRAEKSQMDIVPALSGLTTAQKPMMKNMFSTHAPTTLPTASPGCRFTAAITEVTRSGSDPPKPTM